MTTSHNDYHDDHKTTTPMTMTTTTTTTTAIYTGSLARRFACCFWKSSTTAKGAMEIPTLDELHYNIVVWTTAWAPSQATGSTAASSVAYSSNAVS